MGQMQNMLKGMGGGMGGRGGNMNPQMKAAMDMLAQMQKGGGGKPRCSSGLIGRVKRRFTEFNSSL